MKTIRFRLVAEARARRWSWLALSLLLGLSLGGVVSVVAGARRTDTAYRRFLDSHASSDYVFETGFAGPPLDLDAIARLPGVATAARLKSLVANGRTGSGRTIYASQMAVLAPADGRFGEVVDRWKILAGRRANPHRVDEAVVGFEFARRYGVHVGDSVRLQFQDESTLGSRFARFTATLADHVSGRSASDPRAIFDGPNVAVKVVGIEAAPFDFPPLSGAPPLVLTPAFSDAYAGGLFHTDQLHVRLRRGVDAAAFWPKVVAVNGGRAPAGPRARDFEYGTVQPPLHLQALVLWGLGLLVSLAVGVSLALALARETWIASTDFPVLRALGATRRQLIAIGALRAALLGVAAAVLAALTAFAMSPLWPIGVAGDAEPHPGFAVDWQAFVLGGIAIVLFVICIGVVSTIRLTRIETEPGPRADVWRWKFHRALPVTVALGIERGIRSGRGRERVPTRTAIFALSLATAVVVTVVMFAASTDHLLATPRLYGWVRDGDITTAGLPGLDTTMLAGLKANPHVASIANGAQSVVSVDGVGVVAQGFDNIRGRVRPALLEGREVRADDEIILGTQTMDDTHTRVGAVVTVRTAADTRQMRVVGRAAFAGDGDFKPDSDQGALMTLTALRSLVPDIPAVEIQFTLTRHAPSASVMANLRKAVSPLPVSEGGPPTEVIGFGRATSLPAVVALIMSIIAASSLAYTMANSIRRRRHDFAVLATLGCVRRQLAAMVMAQALTTSLVACAVGVPLGIIAGRLVWNTLAGALTVSPEVRGVGVAIALVVPAITILATLIAAAPAALARRVRPAAVLRSE